MMGKIVDDQHAAPFAAKDDGFLQRDAILLVGKNLRTEFGQALFLHFDEIVDIQFPH